MTKCSCEIKLFSCRSGGLTKTKETHGMAVDLQSSWKPQSLKTANGLHSQRTPELVPCRMRLYEPSAHGTLHCDTVETKSAVLPSHPNEVYCFNVLQKYVTAS